MYNIPKQSLSPKVITPNANLWTFLSLLQMNSANGVMFFPRALKTGNQMEAF